MNLLLFKKSYLLQKCILVKPAFYQMVVLFCLFVCLFVCFYYFIKIINTKAMKDIAFTGIYKINAHA